MNTTSPRPLAPRSEQWRTARIVRIAHFSKALLAALGVAALLSLSASATDSDRLAALAPVTVIREGLAGPTFLAVDANDVVYVCEAKAGRVLKVFPDGHVEKVVEGLKEPQGIAVDANGSLYVAAEELKGTKAKGLVIRRDSGSTQILASGFKHPTGLAVDEKGNVYVAAEGDREDRANGSLFRIDGAGTVVRIATGFKHPQGLVVAPDDELLVAAERLQGQGEAHGGTIFRVNLATGLITPLVGPGYKHPHSLALDRLGALFFSAERKAARDKDGDKDKDKDKGIDEPTEPRHERDAEDEGRGSISRRSPDGTMGTFAVPLDEPTGIVFDHRGHLYVVEAARRRLLRFHAPEPPQLDPLSRFTNQTPITLSGSAEKDTLLTLLGAATPTSVTADSAGRFTTPVVLTPNALNTLQVFAVGAKGQGLVSPPTMATVVHDAIAPSVRLVSPTEGATLTGAFAVEVEAMDAVAGVEGVNLLVDGRLLAVTNVTPYRFTLDAKDFTGGPHTLTIQVTDRAGNQASTSITIIVVTLQIAITLPADGASVGAGSLLVRGTVEAGGQDIGVAVNGIVVAVQGSVFAVQVPVTSEITSLTAMATTATGLTASHRVAITVAGTPEGALVLHASPASGVAPLRVAFSLLGAPASATITLDVDGNGTPDFTGSSLEGQTFTYPQPGLYAPTVTVTDAQGTQLTATALIQVYDRTTLDTLLQAKWTVFRDALRRGDIGGAVGGFAWTSREAYQEQFTALAGVGGLSQIASDLGAITLVRIRDKAAEYDLRSTRNGTEYSFYVLFVVDVDGIWRLWAF